MKSRQFIYSIVLLLSFMPITIIKTFDCHSDAKYHALYPDDDARAHREAAKAMEDCPFCQIQLAQYIVVDTQVLPTVFYTIIREHCCYLLSRFSSPIFYCCLRDPPYFAYSL